MIYVPFIWFLFLSLYYLKKDGISLSAYVSFLFTITSACSVMMSYSGMIEANIVKTITIVPTLVYCILITLAIIPIHKYYYKNTSIKFNDKVLDYFTYFFFAYFLFIVAFLREELIVRTAAANIVDLKDEIYKGDSFDPRTSLGNLWPIMALFLVFGGFPYIMFPIFFIKIIKGNRKWWYYLMAFLGTTPIVLVGMLNIDRSSTIKWFFILGFNTVLFWQYMSKSAKKIVVPIIAFVIVVIGAYLTISTVVRFEDSENGITGSIIEYAGQPFPNFCNFYTNFDNHEGLNTKYLLPATHHYIIGDYESNTLRQAELTRKSGMTCGVFYTFLGTFILDSNQIGPFLFMIIYYILFYVCMKRRRLSNNLRFSDFFGSYALFLIPTFGCISYLYADPGSTTCFFLYLIVILFLTKQKGYNSFISNAR